METRKTDQKERGLGGIEPPTSPTLKENHTTRPKARRRQGAAGIEPATAGSAIPCSTAELCTRGAACLARMHQTRALTNKTKKCEVLPGLEPGSKDSESLVMTNYTTRPRTLRSVAHLKPAAPRPSVQKMDKNKRTTTTNKISKTGVRRLRDSNSRGRVPN